MGWIGLENQISGKKSFLVLLAGIAGSLITLFALARPTPAAPKVALALVAGGLDAPVHITHAGDGSGRIFVVEQRGRIKIIKNGIQQGTFLDITDRVRSPFSGGGNEEGLLSVAFPPGYGSSLAHFYVYYTRENGDNRVSRFSLGLSPDSADPNSEETILDLTHPTNQNHNGGQLQFGPDGYLYIATGDGGGGGDPAGNAQNPGSLLGKLLRIDVESGDSPYGVPSDNPFAGAGGYLEEIWALGLRNPWRFSFDRQTGDLYLGDVGQGSWEEIDYQPASSLGGENYGWNILEGFECYTDPTCDDSGLVPPAHVYATHLDGTCAVTGGYVYRGAAYPDLAGIYLFADYCSGVIWSLQNQGGSWVDQVLLDTTLNITTFGEDEAGELYLTDSSTGSLYRIVQAIFTNPNYLPIILTD
jgi:glucose/arabinose dehydrogenase